MTKKQKLFLIFILCAFNSQSQQLPHYTQFRAFSIAINPATGAQRYFDFRTNYRKQWVKFDGAPTTQAIQLTSRVAKGKMTLGLGYISDITGPTQRNFHNFTYAFNIRMPDVEISMGIAANYTLYTINYNKLLFEKPADNVLHSAPSAQASKFNMGAGVRIHNDRFHIGISALQLIGGASTLNEPPNKKTTVRYIGHNYLTVGYNWSSNSDYIWENSIIAAMVEAAPLYVEYNLRMHYMQKMFFSISGRRGDAICVGGGYTHKKQLQIGYTYDMGLSKLNSFHQNTHEITLVYSTNFTKDDVRKRQKEFARQKYRYML
jgi:type IX secretion system PorP/SprF family membrane protein